MRVEVLQLGRGRHGCWRHDGLPRPYWRLYWNATPGWSLRWAGGSLALEPRHLLLIAPETVYAGLGPGPSDHLYMHVTGDGVLAAAQPAIHAVACDTTVLGLCQALSRADDRPQDSLLAVSLLLLVVARIGPRLAAAPQHPPAIAAALALGERHLHRRIGNAELARAAGMHCSSFVRRFHAEIGLTPQAWHQRQRIAAACLALEGGDEGIDEIAGKLGFCDRHHLTRAFTRLRGIAPAAYRRTAVQRRPEAAG